MAEFHLFLWLSNDPLNIYTTSSLHVGCFQILAIVNNAALNTGVHVSFQINVFIFFGNIPRSGIAVSYGSSKKSYF